MNAQAIPFQTDTPHWSAVFSLFMVWGFLFGFIPVGWSAWIARTLANKAELAGGLSVAVTQFSMGLVAAVGGLSFDTVGIRGNFILAAVFIALAFMLARNCFSLHAKTADSGDANSP